MTAPAEDPARELLRRDAAALWHPYTQHGCEEAPLAVAGARGAELELADGRRVLDAISSWWTCLHGHGEPELVGALARQAAALDHVLFAGATHEPAVALAEALLAAAPPGLARVFFSDDGSTAVEVALKLAWHAARLRDEPRRRVFLALEGGYHGDTFGAMAVGDPEPFFRAYAPLLFRVERAAPEPAALSAAIARLGDELVAVIVEPRVQGAGGMRFHGPELLQAARAGCDATGALLVADEVMTGFGRTGALFACATAGIAPDLLCVAKGLTNGMLPLAATLATERVFAAFRSADRRRFFPHGHSMTANPIGCAVALASLRLAHERDVPARLAAIGDRLRAALAPLERHPRVRALRQLGGIVAFDLEVGGGGYFAQLAPRLRAAALAHGVLLRPLGNVVYALPPACVTDAQCDAIAAAMRALADVE